MTTVIVSQLPPDEQAWPILMRQLRINEAHPQNPAFSELLGMVAFTTRFNSQLSDYPDITMVSSPSISQQLAVTSLHTSHCILLTVATVLACCIIFFIPQGNVNGCLIERPYTRCIHATARRHQTMYSGDARGGVVLARKVECVGVRSNYSRRAARIVEEGHRGASDDSFASTRHSSTTATSLTAPSILAGL